MFSRTLWGSYFATLRSVSKKGSHLIFTLALWHTAFAVSGWSVNAATYFSQTREVSRGSRKCSSHAWAWSRLSVQAASSLGLNVWYIEVVWCLFRTIGLICSKNFQLFNFTTYEVYYNHFFFLYSWFMRWWVKQAHPQASALLAAVQTHLIMVWIRSSRDPFIHSNARRGLLVFYSFLVHSYKTESDICFCKVLNKIDTKYVL